MELVKVWREDSGEQGFAYYINDDDGHHVAQVFHYPCGTKIENFTHNAQLSAENLLEMSVLLKKGKKDSEIDWQDWMIYERDVLRRVGKRKWILDLFSDSTEGVSIRMKKGGKFRVSFRQKRKTFSTAWDAFNYARHCLDPSWKKKQCPMGDW